MRIISYKLLDKTNERLHKMNSQTARFARFANALRILATAFILGSVFMPFATGLKMTVKSSSGNVVTTYGNAFSFMFGGQLVSEHVTYSSKNCSVLGIIGFIFLLLSLVAMVASFITAKKKAKLSKSILLFALIAALSASIMMFCMHSSASSILADAITGNASDAIKNTIYKNTSLSFGFIGPAVFGLASSLILIASFFFDGTVDEIRATIGA